MNKVIVCVTQKIPPVHLGGRLKNLQDTKLLLFDLEMKGQETQLILYMSPFEPYVVKYHIIRTSR